MQNDKNASLRVSKYTQTLIKNTNHSLRTRIHLATNDEPSSCEGSPLGFTEHVI